MVLVRAPLLLLLLSLALGVGSRFVLCIGDNGHVAIELADANCCDASHDGHNDGLCARDGTCGSDCVDHSLSTALSVKRGTAADTVPIVAVLSRFDPSLVNRDRSTAAVPRSFAAALRPSPRHLHTTVEIC